MIYAILKALEKKLAKTSKSFKILYILTLTIKTRFIDNFLTHTF